MVISESTKSSVIWNNKRREYFFRKDTGRVRRLIRGDEKYEEYRPQLLSDISLSKGYAREVISQL